eukprot:2196546-Pleurochrysis_carterae.AAC.1
MCSALLPSLLPSTCPFAYLCLIISLRVASEQVTFGAGHTHGMLYQRLAQQELVLPGGTEGLVGVGGLWLGCGRGMMTQWLGL